MRYQSDGAACSDTRAYGTLLGAMSIEDAISGALAAQLAPLRAEIRQLTAEVEAVRRALPPQLVSVAEAAKALGVSVATIRRRAKDGTLPVRWIGRSLRVDLSAQRASTEAEVMDLVEVARPGSGS